MSNKVKRRFTIFDAMVLVIVIAISLALTRSFFTSHRGPTLSPGSYAYFASAWIVQFAMLGLIPLRLLYSHGPDSRLWRQPGWMACNAVAFALVLTVAQLFFNNAADWVKDPGIPLGSRLTLSIMSTLISRTPGASMVAVAVAWGTLALAGVWESDGEWFERIAMISGFYMLFFPVVGFILAWSKFF
jgi:hypothetical protein